MHVLSKIDFQVSGSRSFSMRRVPSGVELDAVDQQMSIFEEFLVGLSQQESSISRTVLVGFEEYSNIARERINETCGFQNTEAQICNSNQDFLRIAAADGVICAGASSIKNNYSRSTEPLSHALISSGASKGMQGSLQFEASTLLQFIPSHSQLIRGSSGRSRIIDQSSAKQAVISRSRAFSGNLERMPTEVLRRQDHSENCALATFCIFDTKESAKAGRRVHSEILKDNDSVMGFSSTERICSEFSRFVVQIEQSMEKGDLADVVIQVNSFSIASLIARKLKIAIPNTNRRTFHSPDILLGWAAELTVLKSLFAEKSMALLSMQRFPVVEFLYFTKAE